MGNCQTAEAATVVIQHPAGGRTERAYWALSAGAVMAANPGHYVAAVITSPVPPSAASSGSRAPPPVKHLKLLRPDDTLLLGRVYRLVSFEEVLREFASKRQVKLSRVRIKPKEEEAKPSQRRRRRGSSSGVAPEESHRSLAMVMRESDVEEEEEPATASTSSVANPPESDHADGDGDAAPEDSDGDLEALLPPGLSLGRRLGRQWRPALQSIAEGEG